MVESLTVAEAFRQITGWLRSLRYAQTEEERQLKAANVKVLDQDQKSGCLNMSIGSDPEHKFQFFCNQTMMVRSEDPELMNWTMVANDKLEAKMDNPSFNVVAAMSLLALAYFKEKKIQLKAVEEHSASASGDEGSGGDEDVDSAGHFDLTHADFEQATQTGAGRMVRRDKLNTSERVFVSLAKDLKDCTSADMRENGLYVTYSKDDPMTWRVSMFNFPSDSYLARDLEEYSQRFGVGDITAEVRFQPDHPISPPVVRVVRPRLRPGTGNVGNGGAIHFPMVSKDHWIPGYEMRAVLIAARQALLEGCARVEMRVRHDYPRWKKVKGMVRRESRRSGTLALTMTCVEPNSSSRDLERGNLEEKGVRWPFYFRVSSTFSDVSTVCAVPKFEGPADLVVMPVWLMQHLGIENGGQAALVSCHVPMGTDVQFRPMTQDFGRDMDQRGRSALVEISNALGPFFTLTKGDVIPVKVDEKTYWLEVMDCKPADAICIHPTSDSEMLSLNMDLLPALEQRAPTFALGGDDSPAAPAAAASAPGARAPPPPPPRGTPGGSGSGSGSAKPKPAPTPADDFPDEVICKDCGQSVHITVFDVHEDNCPARKKAYRPRHR